MARMVDEGDRSDGRHRTGPDFDPPFDVIEPPALTAAVVMSSPHSGRVYPPRFLESARLDAASLRRSEDAFVDDLFRPAVSLGVPLLRAHFPRAYLDLNREPYELDPRMFDGRLPAYVNTRSVRVAGGSGPLRGSSATARKSTPSDCPWRKRCNASTISISRTMRHSRAFSIVPFEGSGWPS